jgi:amino acid permease
MDMPLQSREEALAKLDPAVRQFYQDQLNRRGTLGSLRITSIATLWLLLLSLLVLLFTWLTGEDVRSMTRFVFVVLTVYLVLFIGRLVLQNIAVRHNRNR